MDDDRARELLAEERRRIEQALATSTVVTTDDESTADDADNATDTYQNEFDEGRSDDLNEQLAAVERAEQRLAEGRRDRRAGRRGRISGDRRCRARR